MKKSTAVLLILLAGVGFLLPELWDRLRGPTQPLLDTATVAQLVRPDLPAIGSARPDVTIVLFTDYRCGVCRRTEAALAEVMAGDPGIRLVYRDWPILGPASLDAARAALASRPQAGYPRFHDALMAAPNPLDPARIAAVARQSGVDPLRLARDAAAGAHAIDATLAETGRLALSLGLPGTPGLVIGRQPYAGGMDAAQIRRAVAEARG